MKVSLASQAAAVEAARDRSSVLARDKGMTSSAAEMQKQHLAAAGETIRWLQANEAAVREYAEQRGKR